MQQNEQSIYQIQTVTELSESGIEMCQFFCVVGVVAMESRLCHHRCSLHFCQVSQLYLATEIITMKEE